MREITDLTVIEIKPEQAPVLYVSGGLDTYLEQIRQAVNEVPDLSTKKGRDRVASLAAQVSRSKTAIEKPGREYLKRLKEAVRPAETEIKRFVDACDELRDSTRRPLTEWEAEQDRIKAEEAMNALHAEALEMNEEFDRQRAAMQKRSTKRRLKPQRVAKLKRKLAQMPQSVSAKKTLTVQNARSRMPSQKKNAKRRKKQIASSVKLKRKKKPVWPKSSAKRKKKRAAQLTKSTAAPSTVVSTQT